MRQARLHEAVSPRTDQSPQQRNTDDGQATPDKCEERAGACTGETPAKAEDRAAQDVVLLWSLGLGIRPGDLVTAHGASPEFLHGRHRDCPHTNRETNNPVHVDALEAEHLLDPEPRDDLRLEEHHSEKGPEKEVDH